MTDPSIQADADLAAAIAERLEDVRDRIASAGGDPARVAVVAVTKGHPARVARAAAATGLGDLGESYGQELAAKAAELSDLAAHGAVRWHAIGRLQRNKVRQIAPHVHLWHSVDRASLAAEIAKRAPGARVLVQVDVTAEATKGGCEPSATGDLVARCSDLGLEVHGLMAMGPTDGDARPGFEQLAALADRLGLPERSMGMSGDLEAAVAAGSTMVRVGTALVGPRPAPRAVGHYPDLA